MVTTLIAGIALLAPAAPQELLKTGTKVPDFTLKTPSGASVKFSGVYSKNKVTILNFWFYQ